MPHVSVIDRVATGGTETGPGVPSDNATSGNVIPPSGWLSLSTTGTSNVTSGRKLNSGNVGSLFSRSGAFGPDVSRNRVDDGSDGANPRNPETPTRRARPMIASR